MSEETPEEFEELSRSGRGPAKRTRDKVIIVRCDSRDHPTKRPIVGELIREVHEDDAVTWYFFGQGFNAEYRRGLRDYRESTGTYGWLSEVRYNDRLSEHMFHDNGGTTYVSSVSGKRTHPGSIPVLDEKSASLPEGVHKTFEMMCPLCRAPLRVREPRIRERLEIAWNANLRELTLERLRRWSSC